MIIDLASSCILETYKKLNIWLLFEKQHDSILQNI